MRSAALLSFALGCGRANFEVCSSDAGGGSGAGIQRVQVVAPGSTIQRTVALPLQQTAGNFALVATYYDPGATSFMFADTLGESWNTLPIETVGCPGSETSVRFHYVVETQTGPNMLTITLSSTYWLGAFAVEYSGVAMPAVDTSSGQIAMATTITMTAGTVETTGNDLVVAVFADRSNAPDTYAADPSARLLAHDDQFAALMEDLPGPSGMYTPSAALHQPSACWVGASVALRAR